VRSQGVTSTRAAWPPPERALVTATSSAEGLAPGSRILLAGLAFKAGTDDLRESPNVDLARKLLGAGFKLEIFDPAIDAETLVGANLGYAFSQLPALERILVDRTRAEAGGYARVLAANATVKALTLADGVDIRHLGALP
jgi:GDP-mannose 6-dehydrogenase